MRPHTHTCGPYAGELADVMLGSEACAWFAELDRHLQAAGVMATGQGGTRLHRVEIPVRGGRVPALVKMQGALPFPRNCAARQVGTAAERAWRVARHLAAQAVGTPEPLAWLERWSGSRCCESYFVTRLLDPVTNMRDALRHLLREEQDAGLVMDLMQAIAPAIRAMHDAGVLHRDLGNQNILLTRDAGGAWVGVHFIDLNRARILPAAPDESQRARDLARLYLPTDLLRVFCEMYFGGPAPGDFKRALRAARFRYNLHAWSRRIRHPIRQARLRRDPAYAPVYPAPREIWLWDEKSAQPINAWASRERNWLMPAHNHFEIIGAVLRSAARVPGPYRELRAGAFGAPRALAGCWGMSVEPRPDAWARERALLPAHPGLPLLIRLYHHKGGAQWDFAIAAGRELATAGFPVSFALCQDRRAVIDPAAWRAFCTRVLPHVAAFAEWVEVGHAVNRVKWGLWSLRDYRHLVEPVAALKAAHPSLRIMGPACIDFEYPQILGALGRLPGGFHFDALSHHLYVDRRGAPENRQGRFSTLEKFALARAIARASRHCEDRLIVSEVNWPLANTGIYSPVCSPYMYPGQIVGAPNVDEQDYARFMVRYLLQAACSGLVERVYWWRLAAHGFGLVDDRAEPWRPRPAYRAWLRLLDVLGNATFDRNLSVGEGAYLHLFRRPDGEQLAVGYAWNARGAAVLPFTCVRAEDLEGAPLPAVPSALSGDPVYFRELTV
ncbi:MAG TPA: lipopolysaccharide kinase InaA family protein [Kiritimatiellia bacterium]|nr:lipopolysaccharide kinase InaA family protein [Kiritimatiellia bacterium]